MIGNERLGGSDRAHRFMSFMPLTIWMLPTNQLWYPCGSFKGDERSAALCKSYADGGLLSGLSKTQLDNGISGSLFRDQAKLTETILRALPQLRDSRNNLEFGYKLAYEGLSEEKSKIESIEIKEQKGFFDGIKNAFNFGGN